MPIVLLVPVVVCLPALRALYAVDGTPVSASRASLAALVAVARIAILSTAATPILWLIYSLEVWHGLALILMVGVLLMVGLPGLMTIEHALAPKGKTSLTKSLATVCLVGLVLAQSGWLLRPFISVRSEPMMVLCPMGDDVFDGLGGHLTIRTSERALASLNCTDKVRTDVLPFIYTLF